MAATEATLGEQIEARWAASRPAGAGAKEPGHINAEAELIKAKDDSVFERLPQSTPRQGRPRRRQGKGGEGAKADRMALPGDGPAVPPTAPSKGAGFSVQEHIEMTKKKEQSVKKALGIDLQERPRDEAQVDVDEKKQVLRQMRSTRSFGGELTSTKKLSWPRRWTS
eukprot:tig00000444_g833.t1